MGHNNYQLAKIEKIIIRKIKNKIKSFYICYKKIIYLHCFCAHGFVVINNYNTSLYDYLY